jgi:hypothetical protein
MMLMVEEYYPVVDLDGRSYPFHKRNPSASGSLDSTEPRYIKLSLYKGYFVVELVGIGSSQSRGSRIVPRQGVSHAMNTAE